VSAGLRPSRSLDVEGAEIEVLKGIDHSRFRFSYLCIECRNIERLSSYLKSVGYVLKEKLTHHDYLFAGSGEHAESQRRRRQTDIGTSPFGRGATL
jgi:hypothetical protein